MNLKHKYRIAFIYDSLVKNEVSIGMSSYKEAYRRAVKAMLEDTSIIASLIYCSTSQIVLKRKYAEMYQNYHQQKN